MRAALFILARWWNARWAASAFSGLPRQAFCTGAWSARPKEKESCHGCGPRAFIAFRCTVASSSDWPPERKTIPGTAAGTCR